MKLSFLKSQCKISFLTAQCGEMLIFGKITWKYFHQFSNRENFIKKLFSWTIFSYSKNILFILEINYATIKRFKNGTPPIQNYFVSFGEGDYSKKSSGSVMSLKNTRLFLKHS